MVHAPEDLLEALLTVLDELPRLLEPTHAGPYLRLERITARLQAGEAPGDWLTRELEAAFREHPRARDRFWEVVQARARPQTPPEGAVRTRGGGGPGVTSRGEKLGPDEGAVHARGGGPVGPPVRGGTAPAGPAVKNLTGRLRKRLRQTVERYADVSCPGRVSLGTPRVSVVVRLRARPPEHAPAAAKWEVGERLPVQVRVEAPDFEVLGPVQQETTVLPEADSPPLVFDLRPLRVGDAHVIFYFFQNGDPVGTVTVRIECTPAEEGPPAAQPPAPLRVGAFPTPPDMVLFIEALSSPRALQFTLMRGGGASWRTFPLVGLEADLAAYADGLYRSLTGITVRSDPTAVLHDRFCARVIPGPEADLRAQQVGQNLWRHLIPDELKAVYAREREGWRDRSLLVFSDEPYLPWELVWPYGENWEDEVPWCGTLGLTRWLRRDAKNCGNDSPPAELALHCLAVLAPTDAGLPTALAERDFLIGLARQRGLQNLSPATPTLEAVQRLLAGGQYDWLHAAAHGKFHRESPDGHSALWLEGGATLAPEALVGRAIEGHLRQRRPAFVFNACEVGRLGRGLTGMGGWATRLISAGAGLFAAPLWEVTDDGALAFVQGFYQRLLKGATVAEAARQARLEARRQGDPTWLAYSVYAHPNARLAPPAEA